jgi:hypothetical protein
MADAEITRATIVNYALIKCLGLPPSFSDDDESPLGGTVDIVWPMTMARTFMLTDWTFSRRTYKLTRQEATPITGWQYAFDLPGTKIGDPLKIARDPQCNSPIRDFYLEGAEMHCNEQTAYARCRVLLDPKYWDPAFLACFVIALGADLAVPVLQNEDLAQKLEAEAFGTPSQGGAGGKFGRLLAQNRAASPIGSNLLDGDPLSTAHWS